MANYRGEDNSTARLTEQDVLDIRAKLASGVTQRVLAALYDIHQTHVSQINLGKRWGWLKAQ